MNFYVTSTLAVFTLLKIVLIYFTLYFIDFYKVLYLKFVICILQSDVINLRCVKFPYAQITSLN